MVASSRTYAVLGATGNCGAALIENLLKHEDTRINAYCRNTEKLMRLFPDIKAEGRVKIFEGNIQDIELLASCIRNCQAVFLVVSTNDNIPGCRLSQDTAAAAIQALLNIQQQCGAEDGDHGVMRMVTPKLVLLSSGTIDEQFSRHVPLMLQPILLRSASYVYRDLIETEKLLRAQQDWLTTIYIKPGALSIDIQRGHALSLTDQDSPVSYLDLAAAMIEAAEDETGRYENRNLTIHNVVHDTTYDKAVIYAFAEADTPFGPYHNEHALFLWFDESGEKVKKIEEMFDTVVMKDILPKINAYVARLKTNGEV